MIGSDFCPPGFGVPTGKELKDEVDAMHRKKKEAAAAAAQGSTAIDEQTKRLRAQLPEIGGRGWNMVGSWNS